MAEVKAKKEAVKRREKEEEIREEARIRDEIEQLNIEE
jgi:hypothetical protein